MTQKYFISSIYTPAGSTTIEKELSSFARKKQNYIMDRSGLEAFTAEIAAEQDRIRAARPRLRPVSIYLSFPPKGWTGTITHITMGQASAAVIEVQGEQYGEKVYTKDQTEVDV